VFSSVLVANRGEIALRVIATLRRLGIAAVAVYSDADATARHVRAADFAVRLGPAPAAESYLHVGRVVEAAVAAGVDALHPGYGFLSENPALAAACAEAGIVFVGPPVAAIETMGDKIRAKAAVAAAGVPVVPGRSGAGLDDAGVAAAALEVGLPVLLKPSAGGGGKGMRRVEDPSSLAGEIAAARREARGAFGDDTLLVERWVPRPRHIEIQVLADSHGGCVHLGERECSLQRRHQKVVEEAPSPLLDEATRAAMGASAVAAARSVSYLGAGTVELIVSGDDPEHFYFMEMNTRLQVEHPVTEAITGLDLVEWQLRVAAGAPLGFSQEDICLEGHAVEARIYAEDPEAGFLPSAGRVLVLREPTGRPGVRVDSGLAVGDRIGTDYDPMLAKVIAHGAHRAEALARLDAALGATAVLGLRTNVAFLRRLLTHPEVVAGRLDTELIGREAHALGVGARSAAGPGGADAAGGGDSSDAAIAAGAAGPTGRGRGAGPGAVLGRDEVLVAAALACLLLRRVALPPDDPWAEVDGWRVGAPAETVLELDIGEGWEVVGVTGAPGDASVRVGDRPARHCRAQLDGEDLVVAIDGRRRELLLGVDGSTLWLGWQGGSWSVRRRDRYEPASATAALAGGRVGSPMPGTVLAVHANAGDAVEAGAPLVTVEAMKMEHVVGAPYAGTVASLPVRPGQAVALGELLAEVAPAGPDDRPAG